MRSSSAWSASSPGRPAWAAGWTALPVLSVSSDFLDTVYQITAAPGVYTAAGTTNGQWMASIIALKIS
jgi:hypothetical protein